MIRWIVYHGFKALKSVPIRLTPLTVFVGPNSSGKTTVLEGIDLLGQLTHRSPDEVFTGSRSAWMLRSSGAPGRMELEARLRERDYVLRVSAEPRSSAEGDWRARRGVDSPWQFEVRGKTPLDTGERLWSDLSEEAQIELRSRFGSVRLLRFDASQLAAPSDSRDLAPIIREDGTGLASVLADLKQNHPGHFVTITEKLQTVIPMVHGIEPIETDNSLDALQRRHTLEFGTASGHHLQAHLMSEGTLLVLGLLTVLLGPEPPKVLLLDDLDRTLHPTAQARLIEIIRDVQDRNPDLQVLATAHSPYLLDALHPDEIRLMTLLADKGEVACAELPQHADFPRWKDVMTPGEFWSMIGEDWVRNLPAEPVEAAG